MFEHGVLRIVRLNRDLELPLVRNQVFLCDLGSRDMLEDHPYFISRVFESSSEQESNWQYLACHFHESPDSRKRLLGKELEEELRESQGKKKKSAQPSILDTRDKRQLLDSSATHRSDHECTDSNNFSRLTTDLRISCLLRLSRSYYGAVACINRAFRSLIRSGETYRERHRKGISEHWVYFSCSAVDWEAYDPYHGRRIMIPKMPSSPAETFTALDKESLAVGTELLVFGKEMHAHIVKRYSILTNTWSPGVVMKSPRCLFGSASLGVKAIVAGGIHDRDVLSSAELYDSESQTWETLPSMNIARKMCSGVFMDGKFIVIGGMSSNNDVLTCGEEYDLERRSWRLIPNMSADLNGANSAPPLVAVVRNELYAAHYVRNEVMKYKKEDNTWVTLGKLPESERSSSVNGWGLAFRACGERLIVICGQGGSNGGILELNSWIPNGGPPEWTIIDRKHSGNFVFNCTVMGC